MSKREEAAALLWLGMSPPEIARIQGVTLETILGYLDAMIGHGVLRRSDVFFSMPRGQRLAASGAPESDSVRQLARRLRQSGVEASEEDVEVIRRYGAPHHALGDFYEDIRAIEVGLHELIKRALREEFGDEHDRWFRQGVPRSVREKCGTRWAGEEATPVPHPYCFTDLIDLRSIIDKRWTTIVSHLPKSLAADKPNLLRNLARLNELRKSVMHPVRGQVPTEDDFDFLWNLRRSLGFQDRRAVITIPVRVLEGLKTQIQALPLDVRSRLQDRLAALA